MATVPDPSTTEWVPLWDLNGLALSAVPPHHGTHDTGGSDAITSISGVVITSGTIVDARLSINVLKFTGGYPGGVTTFLRADGTFAVPPVPGPVGPHAATHSPGGGDTLINGVWTNVNNTFNAVNNFAAGPTSFESGVMIYTNSGAANQHNWSIISGVPDLIISPMRDDFVTTRPGNVILKGTASLTAPGGLGTTPLNADQLLSGTVPAARLTNVAVLNVANIFSQPQRIIGTRPSWEVQHSGNPVIARIGQVVANNRFDIASNIWYDGANWNSDDVSQVSHLYIQQAGGHYFYVAAAGPNPRSGALNLLMTLNPSGANISVGLGTTPLNASNITTGTVPIANLPANVARTDVDNHFSVPQTIPTQSVIRGNNAWLNWVETAAPVDKTTWRMLGYGDGNFWLEALNDAQSVYVARFGFDRANNLVNAGLDAGALNRGTIPLERLPYSEGYFTPVLGGSGGESGQSYSTQTGNYVKIGNFVHVGIYMQFSNNGAIFGNLVVKNLPFAGGGGSPTHAATIGYITNLAPGTVNPRRDVHGYLLAASNQIALYSSDDINLVNMIPMTGADTNIHTQLILSISYRTNY